MLKIFLLTILLISSGCVHITDETHPESENRRPYEIVALAGPNQYQVKLAIPAGCTTVLKQKPGLDTQTIPLPEDSEWIDADVQAGEMISYQLGSFAGQGFDKASEIDVRVPLDLVANSDLDLGVQRLVFSQYNRFFFGPGVVIRTEGSSFTIHAESIFFNNNVIQSFAYGETAAPGTSGRSGGQIEIVANQISGTVTFQLNGENGGQGSNGIAHVSTSGGTDCGPSNGSAGLPGGDEGEVTIRYANGNAFAPHFQQAPGAGGAGGNPENCRIGFNGYAPILRLGQLGNAGAAGAARSSEIYFSDNLVSTSQ